MHLEENKLFYQKILLKDNQLMHLEQKLDCLFPIVISLE